MKSALVTGGAGFIGSRLATALEERYPGVQVSVVDDFRSGHFANLARYRGDLVAADLSRLDMERQFGGCAFDAIFHLASINRTTETDQLLMVHDNVEGFRRVLEFAAPTQTPVVYASSAATYGRRGPPMEEDQEPDPGSPYAFSKAQMDNLARIHARRHPAWRIVGLRYFNVYGPGEGHKGAAASMVHQLLGQMREGRRPRVFADGEQSRDFVHVDDAVEMTVRALRAPESRIYNCGTGAGLSFNRLVRLLGRALGSSLEPEYFENPWPFYQDHTRAAMDRAREDLAFVPRLPPGKGIPLFVEQSAQQQPHG